MHFSWSQLQGIVLTTAIIHLLQWNSSETYSPQTAGYLGQSAVHKNINSKTSSNGLRVLTVTTWFHETVLTWAAAWFSASSFLLVVGKNTMLSIVWINSSWTTHFISKELNSSWSENTSKITEIFRACSKKSP